MPVPISNVVRRAVYAPTGAGGVGPYPFTFEILAATDISVFKGDTLLTLTTHYTVTINANGTGSVTITSAGLALAPVSPTQYAIIGNRTIARTSDFVTGGDFFANTLNDELDQQTIFAQQNAEGLNRALQAPQTDPASINMVLPAKTARALKTLSFDVNGNPTPGVSAADVANAVTYATNAANSATAAAASAASAASSSSSASGSSSTASTQAGISTAQAVISTAQAAAASASAASASASASTATTQAGNASTSASNAASSASAAASSAASASSSVTSAQNAQTAAEAARDQTLASFDSFDDRYLGTKASDPSVDNDGNALVAGALYFNSVDGIIKVYTGSAWVAAYVSGASFVVGAASATDNAVARFDGASGKIIQNSGVVIADDGTTAVSVNSATDALRITQTGAGKGLRVEAASTQDAIAITGRAGGTSSYTCTITPTTLSGNRTITLPNASGTPPLLSTSNTFTGTNTFTGNLNSQHTSTFTNGGVTINSAGGQNFTPAHLNIGASTVNFGNIQFAPGISTASVTLGNIEFQSTTISSQPDAGGVMYFTPAPSSRAAVVSEHFAIRVGTKTMTSNTSLQSIFAGGTSGLTSGALTLPGQTTYFFECSLNLSSMSSTSGNVGFSIVGAGTATFNSAAWHAIGLDATTQTTAAALGGIWSNANAQTGNIVTAATGTACSVLIKGVFSINVGGTIIPSIQLTTAAAAIIGVNTWFKCYPVGFGDVSTTGAWA